jgi:DNA-binding transcriptional ArsR family regulator
LSAERDPADAIFGALADPTRRRILSLVAARGRVTASGLAGELPISRQAIQKHLGSLEAAGLVSGTREGRERVFRATPAPLTDAVGWIAEVGAQWDDRLAALRRQLDRRSASVPRARS